MLIQCIVLLAIVNIGTIVTIVPVVMVYNNSDSWNKSALNSNCTVINSTYTSNYCRNKQDQYIYCYDLYTQLSNVYLNHTYFSDNLHVIGSTDINIILHEISIKYYINNTINCYFDMNNPTDIKLALVEKDERILIFLTLLAPIYLLPMVLFIMLSGGCL